MWTRVLGPGEYGPGAFRWGNVCGLRCSDGRAGVCAAASVLILPKAGFSGWDGFFFFGVSVVGQGLLTCLYTGGGGLFRFRGGGEFHSGKV